MSLVEELTVIDPFRYPVVSQLRQKDNEHMARLNYMASRIRAALCEWANDSSEIEGSDLWWWTGLQKELVSNVQNMIINSPNWK